VLGIAVLRVKYGHVTALWCQGLSLQSPPFSLILFNLTKEMASNSACCIIPPEELWESIETIREQHDKSFGRWMPHINLSWPFVPPEQLKQASQKLATSPLFAKIRPFDIRLSRIAATAGSKYVHFLVDEVIADAPVVAARGKARGKAVVAVKTNMELLCEAIASIFPVREMKLHMTLGQFEQGNIDDQIAQLQRDWVPLQFHVDCVYLISRSSESSPMRIALTIPFQN
jgi:2'-5' RNA ligase